VRVTITYFLVNLYFHGFFQHKMKGLIYFLAPEGSGLIQFDDENP